MVAVIGTNGITLVVWGLGADETAAREDAMKQEGPPDRLWPVDVDADTAARIEAHENDAFTLGLLDGLTLSTIEWLMASG